MWKTNRKVFEINRLFLKEKINNLPRLDRGMSFSDVIFIIGCAKDYFNLKEMEGENPMEFVKRISDFVGAHFPYENGFN